jgi:hypothetical protein
MSRSMTKLLVLRSTTQMIFQTPPTILPLTVGGRGGGGWGEGVSEIAIKLYAQIYSRPDSMQMDGPREISDPPDHSTFNGGGGGVQYDG